MAEQRYVCYNCGEEFRSGAKSDNTNCPHCGRKVYFWRAKMEFMAKNPNDVQLARGPVSTKDMSLGDMSDIARMACLTIKPPILGPGDKKTREGLKGANGVIYLPGDERRALTLFIQENEELVKSCLQDQSNPLQMQWPDDMFQMLVEQWHLLGYSRCD